MSDIEELMRLHAATSTPALAQLCWYDVKPEQADFFEACLEAVPKLSELVKAARALDTMIAYGEVYNDDSEVIAFRAALKPFERQ